MAHKNHDHDNNDQAYEEIDQWELACFQCHKPISADRPPNYNCENCSSVEVGTHANANYVSYPMIRERTMYYGQTHYHNQSPQSYASSNLSGPCPEGPEREDPNTPFTASYLPLGPPIGLNETQHQRTASFNSDLSFPMLRFLRERDYPEHYSTEHITTEGRFLSQDLHIQSQASKKVHNSAKRSKQSYMSMQSSGSHETGFSWGLLDPVTAVGAWDRDGANGHPRDGYALALSGLTEFHINDDTK
ncbi:hypothetical protein N431DRAFT_368469 [Stipitochalara longipes BDJ]|nr:hypothetical protein N431DRAFT_368469 [Stipitochalara longipes BDJ]